MSWTNKPKVTEAEQATLELDSLIANARNGRDTCMTLVAATLELAHKEKVEMKFFLDLVSSALTLVRYESDLETVDFLRKSIEQSEESEITKETVVNSLTYMRDRLQVDCYTRAKACKRLAALITVADKLKGGDNANASE